MQRIWRSTVKISMAQTVTQRISHFKAIFFSKCTFEDDFQLKLFGILKLHLMTCNLKQTGDKLKYFSTFLPTHFNKVSILNSKKSPACLFAKSCFLSAVKMHKVAVIFHEKAEELFGC